MNRIRICFLTLLVVVMLLFTDREWVCAAAVPVTAEIPVQISMAGEVPDSETFYDVVLTAASASNPMPSDSSDGSCRRTVPGNGMLNFVIQYDRPGVYSYQVAQLPGTDSMCTYDDAVYNVTVSVLSRPDAYVLDAVVKAERLGFDGEKSSIVFTNVYSEPDPTGDTETETSGESFDSEHGPETGDDTDLTLYWIMLCASLGIFVVLLWRGYFKKRSESD